MDSIPHNKNNRATKIGKIVEFFITFYRFTELEDQVSWVICGT